MNPIDPSSYLDAMARLMKLNEENVFKVRAFEKAALALAEQEGLTERARQGTLTEIPGVGKGIADVLSEYLIEGSTRTLDALRERLPHGLLELTEISGLGPKKARRVIEELGVHSLGELEYACRENRLAKLEGFGEKLQTKILESIEFKKSTQGSRILGEAQPLAEALTQRFRSRLDPSVRFSETGALRRRCEVLESLDFLVEGEGARDLLVQELAREPSALPVRVHVAQPGYWGYELARTTASNAHWALLESPSRRPYDTEEEFYAERDLPWIPAEAREGRDELTVARAGGLAQLIQDSDIHGVFHLHTARSDGTATLEQMVRAAEKLGYRYIGVTDHSQSAKYAGGLDLALLEEQQREVKDVQQKIPGVKIFWGIESDILQDGSLDYEDAVLEQFDFVIASIHTRFQLDREAMTERMLKAIRNPYTRMIGHLTGRILLGRPAYALDHERVVAEAARCGVAIEVNANPSRLDIDWRWGEVLRREGTRVSINPDAHSTAGLADTRFGVAMARKALLPRSQIVNGVPAQEVEAWLKRR